MRAAPSEVARGEQSAELLAPADWHLVRLRAGAGAVAGIGAGAGAGLWGGSERWGWGGSESWGRATSCKEETDTSCIATAGRSSEGGTSGKGTMTSSLSLPSQSRTCVCRRYV